MDKQQEYFDLLPQCILNYQFIEEALRFCLYRQHAIIVIKLKGYMPYKPPLRSIEKAAMGKLINMYQAFTDDEEFIKELNNIKAKRDDVSHQGYVLTTEEHKDDNLIVGKLSELQDAHKESTSCFDTLRIKMQEIETLVNNVASH